MFKINNFQKILSTVIYNIFMYVLFIHDLFKHVVFETNWILY